ncbi:MAG: hypothetical protein JWR16_519 [Nevskia sp.]|nr:hypothetical protein [Nevskia sp.]
MIAALEQFCHTLLARPDFWGLVSIPLVAALVTWIHVWCAIQMVFFPLEFVGWKPWFGWQGVIPRKARKMSGILVDRVINKLGSVSEFVRQMQPEAIARHVSLHVADHVEEYVDGLMQSESPVLWANLPAVVKAQIYQHVRRSLPPMIDGLALALVAEVDQLVDVREMIASQLELDRGLMVRLFCEVGDAEFRFIINISFWIGLGFGVLQMVLFYFLPWHGLLPLYAAVLGLATNWIALAMVFRPLNPVQIGPLKLHGLFLRRQNQVADKFAQLTSTELLTIKQFMEAIFAGPGAARAQHLLGKHIEPLLDATMVRTALQMALGPPGFAKLKRAVTAKAADIALERLSEEHFNRDRARVLSQLFAQRIRALSSAEFQDLLRPAFQEDEWILLLLGAITGLLAGWLQLVLGFS